MVAAPGVTAVVVAPGVAERVTAAGYGAVVLVITAIFLPVSAVVERPDV